MSSKNNQGVCPRWVSAPVDAGDIQANAGAVVDESCVCPPLVKAVSVEKRLDHHRDL